MRKSTRTTAQRGNIRKSDSYREAKARIIEAHQAGFYIEATALIESIIGDRILSYLAGKHQYPLRQKNGWHHSFGSLINEVRTHCALLNEEGVCVWTTLNVWREARNEIIHGMVRSDPGTATIEVEDFLSQAKQASTTGQSLLRQVLNWHKRELRKSPKP